MFGNWSYKRMAKYTAILPLTLLFIGELFVILGTASSQITAIWPHLRGPMVTVTLIAQIFTAWRTSETLRPTLSNIFQKTPVRQAQYQGEYGAAVTSYQMLTRQWCTFPPPSRQNN